MGEMMKNIKKFLNRKKFKYGGYALLVTAFVLAILIVVNMLASYLDDTFNLSLDLTANQIYSLTSQTDHILEELSQDIYIYVMITDGYEDAPLKELLERYKQGSDYVHVEYVDIVESPGKVSYYENELGVSLSVGGVIVSDSSSTTETKQTYKIIDYYDLYSYDSSSGYYTLFTGENAISGAISYVLNPNLPKVWFLEGHGTESTLWYYMNSYLEYENYTTDEISLLTEADQLEVGDVLIIVAPSIDLSNDERETLLEFALDGGKVMFMLDPIVTDELPNLMLVLSHYNITIEDGMVLEEVGNTDSYISNISYLVPEIISHDITDPLITSQISIVAPQAGAIKIGPDQSGITIENLLETSEESYLEPISETMGDGKDEGAQTGPFPILVAVTKEATGDTEEVKMIVSSSALMFEAAGEVGTTGNYEIFMNMMSWIASDEDDFYIRGKSLQSTVLYFDTKAQIITVIVIVSVIIPLAAFAAAVVVYLRRRHL